MNNENLKQIKKRYNYLLKLKNDIKEKIKRKNELEKDEKVKEYLKLMYELENNELKKLLNKNNNKLLTKVIHEECENIIETNNVYVYIGTYEYTSDPHNHHDDYLTYYDDPLANYRIYRNIENGPIDSFVKVKINECEKFEQNNIVFFPQKGENPNDLYSKIRFDYFNDSIKYGLEKSYERIKSKHDKQKRN